MKHGNGILNSVSTNQVYDGKFESGLKHGIKISNIEVMEPCTTLMGMYMRENGKMA